MKGSNIICIKAIESMIDAFSQEDDISLERRVHIRKMTELCAMIFWYIISGFAVVYFKKSSRTPRYVYAYQRIFS